MIETACCTLLLLAAQPQGQLSLRTSDPDSLDTRRAPSGLTAVRTSGVTLDGSLADAAWSAATPITQFVQKDPIEGATPSQRTEVRVLYDDAAMYVGARLFDTAPDSIVAQLARRDRYVNADRFNVYLDPYHDGRTGVFFGVNAAGTMYDGTLYNDDWSDDTWDGIWEAKVERVEDGWTVEMRIPYSQLRFQRAARHSWGINFSRDIARHNETDWLVFTPKNGSGFVSRFPVMEGLEGITPPRRLEIMPYVTARAEYLDAGAGNPFNDGSRLRSDVGADLKMGLGSNLTLDATINPDFGQVEVDPAVVNLSDSETFFDEKRPFFIEGANIFSFGSGGANNFWGFNNPTPDFLYTRRIGRAPQLGADVPDGGFSDTPIGARIIGAGKLTGKVGGTSFGALSAVTQETRAGIADATGARWTAVVEPLTYFGVARAQREMNGGRSGLGFISTAVVRSLDDVSRDVLAGESFALGADGWTTLDADRTWVLTGWMGASRVSGSEEMISRLQQNSIHYFQRPDAGHVSLDEHATSLSGLGGRFTLNKQKGNVYSNTAVAFLTPGFEVNDLGFQWTSDVVNAHQVVGYRWREPTSWYRSITWNGSLSGSWDFDGNRVHSMLWSNANFQALNYWSYYTTINILPERMNNRRTRGGPLTLNPGGFGAWAGFETDSRKPVVFGLELGVNRFGEAEKGTNVWTNIEWKPADRLTLSLQPTFNRSRLGSQFVGILDDPAATETFGRQYVFAPIDQRTLSSSVRANVIFSPKLSFELYAQPLISSVDYGALGALARPKSYDFVPTTGQVDEDGDGDVDASVSASDFTFASLRGNAVLRWEYLPGSTVYLVWTQSRSASEDIAEFRPGRSFNSLIDAKADNIFLVKLSYWWNP
ncbi:MAG: carbohydrate binding family 9 domain-containing protein [Gemmatimonadota bacterium]|nr:carbohydrate binding family 9 domain-containing protein [Gemmatimonadota bacterium]